MEYTHCSLCGSDSGDLLTVVPDSKIGKRNNFRLVQCCQCGLIYLNPRPTKAEIKDYYDDTYSPHSSAYSNTEVPKKSNNSYYLGRAKEFLVNLPKNFNPGRLLDIGCGDGEWISLMRKHASEVIGVEPSLAATRYAQRQYELDVRAGSLFEQQFPDGYFDIVTFWHSLEHMHDPKAALLEACRISRKGGVITIQVPNINTILFWVFGQHYSMIQAPYHLYHFSPSTLVRLLGESGFKVYRIVYSPGINGVALSFKNWFLEGKRVFHDKTNYCIRKDAFSKSGRGYALNFIKQKIFLPTLKPIGKLLKIIRQGDVFSIYAIKK